MKKTSIFSENWFSQHTFAGIHQALHGDDKDLLEKEGQFMSQMVLRLLDKQKDGTLFNNGLYSFYVFCQRNLSRSYSQILQDLWVLYMLKEKHSGFFVEFGACDGKLLSNTFLLEKDYSWTGILAEPLPMWHHALRNARTCTIDTRCISASSDKNVNFNYIKRMPELSRATEIIPDDIHERNGNRSFFETINVKTVSLLDLLNQYGAPRTIDYLSIDTEGSEYEALKEFDFSKYAFRLITVEHAGDIIKREKIRSLLEENGYKRWRPELSRWDDWYVRIYVDMKK